jgi:hypothetical protein
MLLITYMFTVMAFHATFNNISVISCRSGLSVEETGIPGVLDTNSCDKVRQLSAACRWFSTGTPNFSINKTDHHDINDVLLKMA